MGEEEKRRRRGRGKRRRKPTTIVHVRFSHTESLKRGEADGSNCFNKPYHLQASPEIKSGLSNQRWIFFLTLPALKGHGTCSPG